MTSIDEFFGDYLKTEHVKEEKEYQIKNVKIEKIGRGDQQEKKVVVYFEGLDKGLALNKINSNAIAKVADSREIEDWDGVKVILYVDPDVTYMGDTVGGIRIKSGKLEVDKQDHIWSCFFLNFVV